MSVSDPESTLSIDFCVTNTRILYPVGEFANTESVNNEDLLYID